MTTYRICLSEPERVQQLSPFTAPERVQPTVERVQDSAERVQDSVIKGAKSTRAYKDIEPSGTIKEPKKDMSSSVLAVFAYWQSAMNHPQAKLTPERKKKIEARLEQGYTVAQIQTAIDGCRASPFHMGQNDGGTVFDDLTLICRNGDKLEFFISRSNSSGKPRIAHKETHNERAARETAELIAEAFAPTGGDSGSDPADPIAQGIAVDFRRL